MMCKVRNFQLVLCADVWDHMGKYSVRVLEEAVAAEKAMGGFSNDFLEPLVFCSVRGSRQVSDNLDCWARHTKIKQ